MARRLTEAETDSKRERILRAAIRVFARTGFYDARVADIAKEAKIADGTIYLYFKNKDDVLVTIFEDRLTRLIAFLDRAIQAEVGFDAKLRRVVEAQLGLLRGQRELAEVITINLRQSTRLMKEYAAPLFNQYLDLVARMVSEAQEQKQVRSDVSPRIVARTIFGALDGIALTWALGGQDDEQLVRAAHQVADILVAGLKPIAPTPSL